MVREGDYAGYTLKRSDMNVADRSAWRQITVGTLRTGSFERMIRQVRNGPVNAQQQLRSIDSNFVRDQVNIWLAYRADQETNPDYTW